MCGKVLDGIFLSPFPGILKLLEGSTHHGLPCKGWESQAAGTTWLDLAL